MLGADTMPILTKTILLVISIATYVVMSACHSGNKDEVTNEYSASATALSVDGGKVAIRKASPDDAATMSTLANSLADIDARFPPPPSPKEPLVLYRAKVVQPDGVITMEGGPSIRLDGVSCSEIGIERIARLVTQDSARLAFLSSVDGASTMPIPSEVWLEDISYISAGHPFPASSMIVDTALVSGWCTPLRTDTTKRFDRYVALASLFRKRQESK
jgi:hypothetical protein